MYVGLVCHKHVCRPSCRCGRYVCV